MTSENLTESLLSQYDQSSFVYDEMIDTEGKVRSHWEELLHQLNFLGVNELQNRKVELERFLRESGVTYNIYGDTESITHQWKVDPIPYIISPGMWQILEKGLKQRALVLDLMLKDIYGERKIIKEGIIPWELVYRDRNFLRPCDKIAHIQKHQLLMYAADISRSPDGRLWIVKDYTQAPSGWGYTIENRLAMARVLPELFQNSQVHKISDFYAKIRNALFQFSPLQDTEPRIVLLSPGPMNETYFEHAYLASLQGINLVQGQDLMVKDDFVWLKTMGGLEKIDIIVRRVDDGYCDPLSLRPDSQLGVSGLLDVARMGNVCVANPLGSGILENPGFMAFQAAICKYFTGEDLLIPNIATWWCGQEKELTYVLENLDKLVIKHIDDRGKLKTALGWNLSKENLDHLKKRIKTNPNVYIANEQAIFSTSPSFSKNSLVPRNTVLRSFLMANNGHYDVLPGGLTRSAPTAGDNHVSNQAGGIGKDTWIITSEHTSSSTPIFKNIIDISIMDGLDNLPSRTAESLFWVGRYSNRILFHARFLRSLFDIQADIDNYNDDNDREVFKTLLVALTHLTMTYPGFVGDKGLKNLQDPEKELYEVILDPLKVGGLAYSINMWKNAANAIRGHWSADTWRLFDQLEETWKSSQVEARVNNRVLRSSFDRLINEIMALMGFIEDSMSIQEGRPLYKIGSYLERGILITALIRATAVFYHNESITNELLEVILKNNESLNTYRYRYRNNLELTHVLDMVLLDSNTPQSLVFVLELLKKELRYLPEFSATRRIRDEEKKVIKTLSSLQTCDLKDLIVVETDSFLREGLDIFLASGRENLTSCANIIINNYFSHIDNEQQHPLFLFDIDL